MAEKMAKTCQKGYDGKRSASLKNLLEKPKTLISSCSINIDDSKIPCKHEAIQRKIIRKHGECEIVSSDDSVLRYWLKPGISLPKIHGMSQGDTSPRERTPPTPSTGSWKSNVPMQSVVMPAPSVTTPACFLRSRTKTEQFPGKVIGPTLCHSSFVYSVITKNDLKLEDGRVEESSALQNWEKWMKIRRNQNNRFAKKLKRDKCKLVMNTGDCVREVREEKDLLTFARLPRSDEWRGNPKWWTEPPKLARKGMKTRYYAYEMLHERGMVPPLEFVSVPDAMKEEKDEACRDCSGNANWHKSEYRKMQEEQYSQQLEHLVPHKVEARELVIVGEKIGHNIEKESPMQFVLPDIKINLVDPCPRKMEGCQSMSGIISLVVNGLDLFSYRYNDCRWEVTPLEGCHTWSLIFEEAPIGTITSKTFLVENTGIVAVRYKWTNHRQDTYHSTFPARKTSTSGPYFFFDKNPGVFLPGQKTELEFFHHSKKAGYHTETWCLRLNPNISNEEDGAKITLIAVTGTRETITDFSKTEVYLESCVKETLIRNVLGGLLELAEPEMPEDIEYLSLFTDEELFEYQNGGHYYRFDDVEELKSVFKQITVQPPQEWDLNLFTLEDLIRDYVTGKQQREMMCRLMELSRSLLRPGPSNNKLYRKRKMLYNVLCSVVDAIEESAHRIRDVFSKMEQIGCDKSEFFEEEDTRLCSAKSGRSPVSSFTSLGVPDDGSLCSRPSSDENAFKATLKDMAYYRYVLHMMFFNYLCEAAEIASGVIESCKLFEHHGEVLTCENTKFLYNDSF